MELGHGDPRDPDGPQVRVATKEADDPSIEARATGQELVHSLWNDGADHTDAIQAPFTAEDATEGWRDIEIAVDGSPAPFKMLDGKHSWVALAQINEYLVTVRGQNIGPDEVNLVRLDDLNPYLNADAFPWTEWPDDQSDR